MKITQSNLFVTLAVLFVPLLLYPPVVAQETSTPASKLQQLPIENSDDTAKTIEWRILAPNNGKPFHDPFAELTQEQLADLSFVDRVQRLIAENKIRADGVDAKDAADLVRKLKNEGIDIGWLMAQRQRVQQMRGQQIDDVAKSIVESMGDTRVTLAGYVIPAKVDEGRLTEFFLVPTTAACSHEDPPPRLQVVFVATEQGITPPGRGMPLRVTGKVVAVSTTRKTSNANGRVNVYSAYAISSPEITMFQATKKLLTRSEQ